MDDLESKTWDELRILLQHVKSQKPIDMDLYSKVRHEYHKKIETIKFTEHVGFSQAEFQEAESRHGMRCDTG